MPKRKRINHDITAEKIRRLLLNGPASSREICNTLGISQPVFSRLVVKLGPEVLITGKASKTMYALKREVPSLGNKIELFRVDRKGQASNLGSLFAIFPDGFYFQCDFAADENGFHNDLPFFLHDLRPSGFLGRNIPRQHPELEFPENITTWTSNTVLSYLGKFGSDLIGNLIAGSSAFQKYADRFQHLTPDVLTEERATQYERMASDVLQLGDPGSSAGGEQAKFLVTVGPTAKQSIVKFSPPLSEAVGRRRGDLLVCEHIAHNTLRESGKKAAISEMIAGKYRIFLEVERFDRTPPRGRIGIISLQALFLAFCNGEPSWPKATQSLLDQKRISRTIHNNVRFLHLFGKLIANSDMHFGNLSFVFEDLKVQDLAPAYDMLPSLYAPIDGQLVSQEFAPPFPAPADGDIWKECYKAACTFWERVSTHPLISDNFQRIAGSNLNILHTLKGAGDMLPKTEEMP